MWVTLKMKSSILLITELQGHTQCIANTEKSAVGSSEGWCLPRNNLRGRRERQHKGQSPFWSMWDSVQ